MVDKAVLSELASEVLPHWIDRLRTYIPLENKADVTITPAAISMSPEGKGEAQKTTTTDSPGPLNDLKAFIPLTQTHGMSKLDSRPDLNKTRFSAISGPTIYYDGEKQAMLNNLWNTINSKRGLLRREMIDLKRRQQFAAIASEISEESSEDDEENKEDAEEEDDDAELLKMKMKLQREKILRMSRTAGYVMASTPSSGNKRKAGSSLAMQTNPEEDSKLRTLLEGIDDNLDKATKVCETAAFIWLKGDPVTAHLKFMIGRLRDTIIKIQESGFIERKDEEPDKKQSVEAAFQKTEGVDVPMPPISKAVAGQLDVQMKDADSALEIPADDDDAEASSIDTTDNPKMAALKRRMKESAANIEGRQANLHGGVLS